VTPDGDVPVRYRDERPSVRAAWATLIAAVLAGILAEAFDWFFWLDHPPVTQADLVAFVLFQWLPLLFWLGVGLSALAKTRPWWGREIRGSRYWDHRSLLGDKRYDLAKVSRVQVGGGDDEQGSFFTLGFSFPGERGSHSIRLPVSGDTPQACRGHGRDLVLALADALDEHPDQGVVECAVADLRFLADATGAQVTGWVADMVRARGFRARSSRARAQRLSSQR
jgi:hypothetical protein